jgi:hypothetical protein
MNKLTRKLGFGLGLLLATLMVISPGFGQSAQTPKQKEDPSTQTPAQTVTIDGKVSAVTETTVTVVDAQQAEKVVAIDANTKITKNGKEATAADIKAEDSVVVVAKADGEALTAITIKVA